MALHFLADYNVFDAVPLKGSIPYSELSKKVGLGEHRLRRVLAMAFTQHYFHEPKPDHVAHTSNTAIWHGDSRARAWILHNTEEVQPWYTNKLIAASRKWGDTTDPYHVGPNLDLKPSEYKTFYQHFEEDDSGEWNGVKGKGWRLWRLYETDTASFVPITFHQLVLDSNVHLTCENVVLHDRWCYQRRERAACFRLEGARQSNGRRCTS